MILFEKFGQHQPLNRQAERYALEGVPISLSTMADAVGSSCAALDPVLRLVEAHTLAAERLHGDDTTVPVLAKGKTDTGRCWVYVRDDKPFGGTSPPAAMFYYSRDRKGEHPQTHLAGYAGLFQADAFDGYRKLYLPNRTRGPILEAGCWVHARRPFFAMADLDENARRRAAGKKVIALSPIAIEVVRRIDALFEIERPINGKSADERRAVRQELSKPLVEELQRLRKRAARQTLPWPRPRQGHRLYPQALDRLHPVPRRRARLLVEQRRRAGAPRDCSRPKIMDVLRIRPRWSARRGNVQPHRHGQDEQRRSSSLAGRRPGPDRCASCSPARRVVALELGTQGIHHVHHGRCGGLTLAPVNKVHHVHTIARVAEMLGEDEDWLGNVANEMDQEDGLIWVYGKADDGVMAFTDFGIETLTGIVEIYKANSDLRKRPTDPE